MEKLYRCVTSCGGVIIVKAISKPDAYKKALEYLSHKTLNYTINFDDVIEHHSDCVFYTFD